MPGRRDVSLIGTIFAGESLLNGSKHHSSVPPFST
jgi:hypothetical protein